LAVALLVLAPWAARDLFLSGYVAYPLPYLTAPVPWRIPRPWVDQERIIIGSFAKDPLKRCPWPVHGFGWLYDWGLLLLERYFFEVIVPLVILLLALCLALAQRRMSGVARSRRVAMGLFLSVPSAAILFWFLTAPHPRFAAGSLWVFAAGANAFLLERFGAARRRLAWGLAALLIGAILYLHGRNWPILTPGAEDGFHPLVVGTTTEFRTDSGLVLHVPVESDRCWNAPLPATPYPKRNLRLRVPGDMGKGFELSEGNRPQTLEPVRSYRLDGSDMPGYISWHQLVLFVT
jgi:hypothetical protein